MNYATFNSQYKPKRTKCRPTNYTQYGKPSSNIKTNAFFDKPDFMLFDETHSGYNKVSGNQKAISATRGILNGIDDGTTPSDIHPVIALFFSNENIQLIQLNIKKEVLRRTQGKYKLEAEQNENDLLIVMRAIVFDANTGARYLPTNIKQQVYQLNKQVVKYIMPEMITAIEQYYGYLKEINQPLQTMLRPLNVNNAGRKTLPSITTIYDI